MFSCLRCGAHNAITLPTDGSPEVVCPACHTRQSRREYELLRVRGEVQAARTDGARASLLAPLIVFVVLAAADLGGVLTLTHVTRDKLGFTIAVALTGAFLCAFGVRALQRPTTLEIVDNRGEDGSGMQRWGNARKTTAQQGTMVGAVCIAIGAVALVSGFFLGALRPW